ncbi:calcium-binding protein [Luteimonas sp. MJ250]|uniref:calcium-binding protein n=1 Tax=Luteimonas sp. MJ250 TaxID=3129236 RepID=UPI0031BB3537
MADAPKDPKPLRKIVYPFPKTDASDPAQPKQVEVKDADDYFKALSQAQDGFYPIGYNGQWHGGVHFGAETGTALAQDGGIRCIADGEVIAYRIDEAYPTVEYTTCAAATYSRGFSLVRHRLQLPLAPPAGQSNQNGRAGANNTSGTTAQTQAEPSLVFYSLYMHLRNWKAYEADVKLKRPGFWDGDKEYVVGEKAKDKEEALAPGQTGLRVRDSSHVAIAILPRGTRLKLGAAVAGRSGFHEIASITSGDTIPSGQHTGRAYLPELDPITTPSAKGTVVVLAKPVEIKAGDLMGHPGQYQRYSDMNPLATTCTDRPLVQLDIFTGEDLEDFIEKSRARDVQLDAKQKTLLHIKPGARFVQPAEADVDLPAGEAAAFTDGDTSDRWVKGRRGTLQTVERTTLGVITMATRTYPNGSIFITAVNPSNGNELTLEQYNALPNADQGAYSQRKVLTPAAGDIWLDRNAANASDMVQGPARVWSEFPLTVANAAGEATEHSRVVAIKSVEATAKDADGTRWLLADAGGGTTGTLQGWVREKDHPNVVLCSPWAWPGFVLMDTGSLQPKDLYGRMLTQTRQAQASERDKMETLSQSAEKGPLFDALCKAIDADGKDGITPMELRSALGKPWLAQALSRLAIMHHSEWAGPMDRWDAIDELIPEPRKEDWEKEKGRIRELQFWDDVKGKSGFPTELRAHHLHPIGLVENFSDSCPESCKVDYFELQTSPGPFRVSKESFEYILGVEKYEEFPYVPSGKSASGITIGYGYDLGHQTEFVVRIDLQGLYTAEQIDGLVAVLGKTQQSARDSLSTVSDYSISKGDAMTLALRMKRRYAEQVVEVYPKAVDFHPHCQGALLSLVINRGNSFTKPSEASRLEMKQIKEDFDNNTPEKIRERIRSMKRLWENTGQGGLLTRRDKEAEFFERGLKCDCWE